MNHRQHGWATVALGELVRGIAYGHTASAEAEAVGPRFLRITDLSDAGVDWKSVPYCRCDDTNKYALKRGDIVFARTGATTGKNYLISDLLETTVFASYLIRLDTSSEFPPEYLSHYFRSPRYWRQITERSKGTAQPGVNASVLSKLEVPLPPLREQRRIVAKLDDLTARSRRAREALEKIPPLLERFRQSVLAAAFRGDLTSAWRARNSQAEGALALLDEIEESRRRGSEDRRRRVGRGHKWVNAFEDSKVAGSELLSDLPASWAWSTLGSVCEVTDPNPSHRYPESYDGGTVPILSVQEFEGSDGWNPSSAKLAPESFWREQFERLRPAIGEAIVFARKGRLGLARRLPRAERYCFSHTVFILTPEAQMDSAYLLWFLRQDSVIQWLLRELQHGAGVPTLGKAILCRLPVPMPPIAEQRLIAQQVERLSQRAQFVQEVLEKHTSQLALMERAILAKAFRGELVPHDPNDEPASVLLERIRAEREKNGGGNLKGKRGRKPRAESIEQES